MLRASALWLLVAFLCAYAFRSWFTALCGLVLLTVVSQHPDMPHSVLGISGLNPWNLVFFAVVAASLTDRKTQRLTPPRGFSIFLKAYVALLIVSGLRALLDLGPVYVRGNIRTVSDGVFELWLNPLKYLFVGFLLFRGCQTRKQLWMAIHTLLLFGLLHALLMYKTLKGMVFFGDYKDARRLTDKMVGLDANDLAGLLTLAFWSFVVYAIVQKGRVRVFALLAAAVILPAMVGCYSRAAFIANVVIALLLGIVRWRKLLMLLPLGGLAVTLVFPRIITRMTMDVSVENIAGEYGTDWNELTAGRTAGIWEPTIDQIRQSPLIGFGRYTLYRTSCYNAILEREGSVPAHPHNSYLEVLLDSGIIGLLIVLGLMASVGSMALQMARAVQNSLVGLVGGIGLTTLACAATLGMSASFFYPREPLLWLTCGVAITVRAWVAWHAEKPGVALLARTSFVVA